MSEFDRIIDRRDTASTKWDRYRGRDVLPFWVADTDFRTPDFILDRVRARLDHGVLGYTDVPEALTAAARRWLARHFDWHVAADWLLWLPGVVPGLNLACRAAGAPGDRVMLNTPVYYPFLDAPGHAARIGIRVPLERNPARNGRWEMDFAAMEAAVTADTRLFLLCNPQNPTGRIYEAGELERLAGFCERHGLFICSDEIHCSLLLDSATPHRPIAAHCPRIAERSITLMSPNKTYNLAGLSSAFAIIPDPSLRRRFLDARAGLVPGPGALAYSAATAAYEDSSDWVARLNGYLARNRDRLAACIEALPGIAMAPVEATYLGWIDVRALELEDPAAYFETFGLGLSPGSRFGGRGFVRFNFGCPRATLDQGLERLRRAVLARARA